MSQAADYTVDNSTGANVRIDLNAIFGAIATNNSAGSDNGSIQNLGFFADTTLQKLRLKEATGNNFVNLRGFDGSLPLPDGSDSSPSLFFDDDTNTGIFSGGADEFNISTGGTERFVINSSGVVGINISSPDSNSMLDVMSDKTGTTVNSNRVAIFRTNGGNRDAHITFSNSSNTPVHIGQLTSDLYFSTGDEERMRIDSSGNVFLGTTTARGLGKLEIEGTSFENSGLTLVRNSNNTGSTAINICKSRGGIGSVTSVASGDVLGGINFRGADGANLRDACDIRGEVDGTPSQGSDMPGRLVFRTSADGSSSPTERMRIASDGSIIFNRTNTTISTSSHGASFLVMSASTGSVLFKTSRAASGSFSTAEFYGTGGQCNILGDGDVVNTNNSYSQISDETLKQDIVDAASQWNDIKAIKVRKFRFKDNPTGDLQIGVVAQEIEKVSPKLVKEIAKFSDDINSTETVKAVKYSILYMKAIKALQEAMTRIETLETKVEALEAA